MTTRDALPRAPHANARLTDFLAAWAAHTPDAPALRHPGGDLSFARLEADAGALSQRLRELGAGPERLVALALPRSAEMVVAQLAVLRTGAAFLPVDPDYPAERVRHMLADARPAVLVTSSDVVRTLPACDAPALLVDGGAAATAAPAEPGPVDAAHPAYVIYTSGSTGVPKGVVVTHAGLAGFAAAEAEHFHAGPGDRVLMFSSPSFDASVLELCLALAAGATMVVPPPGPLLGAELAALLDRERITHTLIPPVALATVPAGAELPHLRTLVVGADACPPDLVARWSPGRRMVNAYGPTEATVVSTWSDALEPGGDVPIGTQIPGTRAYVLDADLRPTTTGELYVAGSGLARGYLGQPGLTADRFLPDPYGAPGTRMYRTGDRVRSGDDGQLRFLGRADHQVKIRGFRIEPGEIEAALRAQPGVRDAVVVARADETGLKRLVAYVIGASDGLRERIAEVLPAHLVPAAVLELAEFPLSPNGKLDRSALPEPTWRTDTPAGARTATEEVVTRVWASVLGVPDVGVDDDFLAIGGDSILATRVAAGVSAELGTGVGLRSVFEARTPAALAALLDAGVGTAPIEPGSATGPVPLSAAQRRLWLLDRTDPGSPEYNTGAAMRVSGRVDLDVLRDALNAVAGRHEALRTTFPDGVQVVSPQARIPLAVSTPQNRDQALVDELRAPFDLAAGPLTRAVLLSDGDDHVLLIAQHHIITDGWSVRLLVDELLEHYRAALTGDLPRVPTLPVTYRDFSEWQRVRLTDDELEPHLRQLHADLAGLPVLDLPTDHPRPRTRSRTGAAHRADLGAPLADALARLARAEDASLFTVLTAAVQLLLSTYTRQRDIAVGTITSGRDRPEVQDLLGFFVNTVVLRSEVDGRRSVSDLIAAVRATVLEMFGHAAVPFDRLVEELRPARDPGRTPLTQALVLLQQPAPAPRDVAGLRVVDHFLPRPASRFDLVFEFTPREGSIELAVEYDTALFEPATVDRMATHLTRLLAAFADAPHARLGELSALTDDERRRVLEGWNPAVAPSADAIVPDLFERQAASTPDAVAVACGGVELTYRELDERANRLAHVLAERGAGPERFVAVALPRTADLVTALLAVLKTGAAYQPIDLAYPAERIAALLADTRPPLIITEDGSLPGATLSLAGIDLSDRPATPPARGVRSDNPAYVIHTSGSTGRPKGVVVTHATVADLVAWAAEDIGAALTRVAASTSLNFDVSVFEIFGPLLTGGCVELVRDVLAVGEGEAASATLVSGVPSAFTQMLAGGGLAAQPALVVLAGEALTPHVAEQVRRALPGARVANIYGPTEATVYATAWYADGDPGSAVPIGRPVTGTRAYVLDAELRPVPVGVPGELHLGGRGLARGYLDQPGLTADRFIADPHGGPGARMYRTGDVVRWTADGELLYLGRADHQVKIRGFRVELGEIDAVLVRHERVAESVTVAREDGGHRRLVSYVVGSADPAELRAFVGATLPEYLVPAAVVVLDALPLNPNGKLDRGALPAPDFGGGAEHVAPRTDTERVLAEVWAEVLGVDLVGVHDNFFLLGGDSILGLRVAARAREAGLRVVSRDLFLHQTVAELAPHVTAADGVRSEQGVVSGDAPLTPVQHWMFTTTPEHPGHFQQSIAVSLTPDVDADALRGALAALVEHHDALRARFTLVGGQWRQHVAESETGALLRTDAATGVDLERGPLLRAALDGSRLTLAVHHLVVDTVSWRVLLEDLGTAYGQLRRGEPVRLPAKSTSFRDWARGLADHAQAGGFLDEVDRWASTADPALPVDRPGAAVGTRTVTARLTPEQTGALLHDVPDAYRTRINDVLLAALGRVLADWTGRDAVPVTLEGHGREDDLLPDVDLSRTVGWFTAMHPVVVRGHADWATALKATKEDLRAIPRHGIGHGALRHLSGDLPPAPGPLISVNYLGHSDLPDTGGLVTGVERELELITHPDAERPHLIDVVAQVRSGALETTWFYSPGVHDEPTVARLADALATALAEIVAHCAEPGSGGRTPSDFPLARLSQSEVDALVGGDVEDIFPLTHAQAGMAFHRSAGDGAYLQQIDFVLDGVPDPGALAQAWRTVAKRTPALRTELVWEGVPEPLQRVRRDVPLPVRVVDWTGLDQAAEREGLLAADRAEGVDLAAAPLTRVTIARLSPTEARVFWTFHHVLLDGWSLFHVLTDVLAQHAALRDGAPAQLPARPPFRDHLAWLAAQDHAEAQDYWRAALAGVADATGLPFDRPPTPDRQSQSSAREDVRLDACATAALTDVAQRNGLTLGTLLRGAWALMLAHHDVTRPDGTRDVLFGTTVSGRPAELPGVESMVGMFITTIPTRVRVSPGDALLQWLRGLQDEQTRAQRFDYLPPAKVRAGTGLPEPLFHSIVVVENYPVTAHGMRELTGVESTNYPLSVVVYPGDELGLAFGYDPGLFDAATVRGLAGRLLTLLRGIADDPARPALDIPVLDDAERATLASWQGGESRAPAATVPELFAERVRTAPDAPAVVADGVLLTAAALAERANRLANRLIALGVRPDERVALLLDRSPDVVVAELAVLTAGAAYLPLDTRAPVSRLRDLLAFSDVRVVLTDATRAELTGEAHTGHIVLVDDPALADEPVHAPSVDIAPDSLAYVMFTSGSTGTPKGVAVRHADITALAAESRFAPHDCALLHSPLAFDATTYEVWVPLLRGGRVAVAPPGDLDPAILRALVTAHGVTGMFLTSGLFRVFAEDDPGCFGGLREVWTGGDVVPAAAIRAVIAACDDLTVVDVYGPTETTTFATSHPMTGEVPESVPIGRPLDGMRAYVLDADLRPVPIGASGELFLAGAGLARGYLGQPGRTADRFLADPFARDGGRMYRTGDLVRWSADGELNFLGRIDDQVKVRGFRIEPGEIEAALLRHPDVAQAVVVAHRRDGRTRLVGYTMPVPGGLADPVVLRDFLAESLPDYMVPSVLVPMAALPLSANGKVDHRALPEPDWSTTGRHVEPTTDAERVLTGIWAGLLGAERIGALDNFFERGGDSILSIQMVSRARSAGLGLTAREVFAHPTLTALAARATRLTEDARVDQGPVTGPAPLTPIQHWYLDAPNPDHARFTQSATLELAPGTDPDALRRAMTALVHHHDALRTRFTKDDSGWRQCGHEPEPAYFELTDGDPDAVAASLAERLDLADGPLLRAALLPGPLLVVVVHHLVVDGVSWRVLLEDLETAYAQAVDGREITLPDKTTPFRDWARALREHATAGGFDGEADHWSALDADPALPVDGEGGGTIADMGAVTARLDAEHTRALLNTVPAAYRTRIDDVLLAALGAVLTDWSGRDRVLVDLEGHGREEDAAGTAVDLSRTVGWFTSIYPVELRAHPDWATALKATKESLRAVPGRGVGHGALRHLVGALTGEAPRISFNYLGQFDWASTGWIRGVRGGIGGQAHPDLPRPHQLDVVGQVSGGELEFTWYHDRGAHRAETVRGLADGLLAALRVIVAHCAGPGAGGRTPSDFPLARLDQSQVDSLDGVVDDVYPLTPMQEGMVFHSLVDGGTDAYFNQVVLTLDGVADSQALAEAWRATVAANPVLRTQIREGALQVVRGDIELPVAVLDWSGLDRAAALADFLADDRAAGVDLTAPPLLRVAIAPEAGGRVVVVWTFHHVLLDGWSAAEVFAEVCARYAARTGRPVPEPAPRRPFRDYLGWLAERDHDAAERFWRTELADVGEPTPLPFDRHPVGAHRAASSRSVRVALPADVSDRLRSGAQKHGLTVSTVVQGAWGLLLARFSGRDDVVFGTTVSGRPADLPGVESMVGLFINTVPTRIRVRSAMPTAAWLAEAQAWQAEARRYDYAPLNKLRTWSGVPAGANLFDSIVVFENYPFDTDALAATGVRLVESTDAEPTNYPISVVVRPGDALVLDIDHDPALFDESTARRLADHLELLLTAIAADQTTPLAELPVFTDAQARALTPTPEPEPGTVTARWARAVAADPGAVAVLADGLAWSRAEVDARANRLAHRLLRLGVSPERPVALLLERSPDVVAVELAVLKAGGAYLPLDTRAPRGRLRELISQAGARVVLTDESWRAVASEVHSGQVESVADAAGPSDAPAVEVAPDSLAYVMYTSGSTGTPKGVAVRHRDITALASDARFATDAHDCVLLHSPLAFDATTYEIWVPLLRGGRVVVAPPGDVDPALLRRLTDAHGITGLWLTAGLFRVIAEDDPGCLSGLREVWTGGDVVPAASVRAVLAACPGLTVVDGYGPTETTTFATSYPVPAQPPEVIPIGAPLDGVRAHVLDRDLRPVPVGAPGELHLGGAGLARGYLGRPGLTAARFVADPFGVPGERFYRTGDIVAWTDDGALRFLGRVDDQVKIRGFRIEPGEVEAVVAAHPAVGQAVVVVRAEGRSKRLVAYAVGGAELDELTADQLRAHCAERLPDYMVPSAFVLLPEFPLTANGKVDRRALPEPAAEMVAPVSLVTPRTPQEIALAQVWAGVLGVDDVGADDDFFALGGDSILSIQVVTRARAHGLRITPRDVFDHPTVAGLAAVAQPLVTAGDAGPVTGDAPLTPVQRWFFETVGPDERFDQSITLGLAPDVDADALERALRALVEHHDALRMRYTRDASGWRQHNAAPEDRPVLGTAGYTFADGPLLTAELSSSRLSSSRLRLAVHHLVVDGVSWRVLLEDLDTAYRQAAAGERVDLGRRTTAFRDWARRLADHATAGGFDDEVAYWRSVVAAESALPLDLDGPNSAASTAERTVWLDTEETRALLRDVPAAYHTRVNDVLLTALGAVLAEWTGRDRVLVEVEGHGREEGAAGDAGIPVDLSRTVGWFTSMYPVALEARADLGAALRATKENLRAIPRNGVGYGVLRHLTGQLADVPEQAIGFNYLGRFDWSALAGELVAKVGALESDVSPTANRPHLLDVVARVEGDRLGITWMYSTQVHRAETVSALARGTAETLRRIIGMGGGGHTPSDFPLAGLDQSQVDALTGGRVIEDIYPLTPMQAGMVFHGLSQAEQGVYLEQVSFVLDGVDDVAALGDAWRHVVAWTPVLRSAIAWDRLPEPVQLVHRRVELPVTLLDWTGDDQDARLRELLEQDKARGIDVTAAPLLRVALARVSPTDVRVLWTFHHVLLDGWSVFHVLADVLDAYAALRAGRAPALVDRPPFRDYLHWLSEQDHERAAAHWRQVMAGFAEPTPLPLDRRPSPGHAPRSSAWVSDGLDIERTSALTLFARRHQLTVNALFQGAWALLLAAHSGSRDVCFGATAAGRPAELPDVDRITGIFITTLPVRVPMPSAQAVVPWLRALQADQAAARSAQHVSLAVAQEGSDLPAGVAAFDSIVVFENYPVAADADSGPALRDLDARETTNYPLTLVAAPGERLGVELGYDPDLVDEATARRLCAQVVSLLGTLVEQPGTPLGALDLRPHGDRAVLERWSGADAPGAQAPPLLPELIAARAASLPGLPAIVGEQGEVGYGELDAMANRLAHLLIAEGAGPESVIALALPRSVDIVVAQLAAWRAGAAYLPIDPTYPPDRIAFMLADAAPLLVLTDRASAPVLRDLAGSAGGPRVVVLDSTTAAEQPEHAPVVDLLPEHPAYIIYTSGSTGTPKGVTVCHSGLPAFAAAEAEHFRIAQGDRVLMFSSPSFDASVLELCLALPSGAAMVVPPAGPLLGEQLADVLTRNRVTHALIPPVALATLDADAALPDLRTLISGGDACTPELVRRWAPGRRMINAYGPTESTVVTAWSEPMRPGAGTPIGRPIPGTRVLVLDADLRPVPVGAPGELHVGGVGLARGYLGRPGLTADRFVPDPTGPPGARMYRTGDRVRWGAAGVLEFLGRTDHQVKVRGFRVELGEIEARLRDEPGVDDAVVIARDERLVAYVTGAEADPDALRASLGKSLPDYLVPAVIAVLPALPLTPNGKLDRAALPDPGAPAARAERVEPRTDTEAVLAEIWAEVLGLPDVGVTDSFFDLGGDSVRALRIGSRAREVFDVALTPRDVLTARTIAALAEVVEDHILVELERAATLDQRAPGGHR